MRKIMSSTVVANPYPNKFNESLCRFIEEFQNRGYEVEIQYKPVNKAYTALILGYEEVDK